MDDPYNPVEEFPPPFDTVAESFHESLQVHPHQVYTDAHDMTRIDFISGIVSVLPDGTFTSRWDGLLGQEEIAGEWALDNGIPVVTFDDDGLRGWADRQRRHAAAVEVGRTDAALLRGYQAGTDLYEVAMNWTGDGFTATLNNHTAYEISCTKLSDDVDPMSGLNQPDDS